MGFGVEERAKSPRVLLGQLRQETRASAETERFVNDLARIYYLEAVQAISKADTSPIRSLAKSPVRGSGPSVGRVISEWYESRPLKEKELVRERVLSRRANAATPAFNITGGLVPRPALSWMPTVNIGSRTYVGQQVDPKEIFGWVTPDTFQKIAEEVEGLITAVPTGVSDPASRLRQGLGGRGGVTAPITPTHTKVDFRVTVVKCVVETTELPEWLPGARRGQDEIHLGGTAIMDGGAQTEIKRFKVGNFDSGDYNKYDPPRILTTFNLSGESYPVTIGAMVSLCESDGLGEFGEFLQKLMTAANLEADDILKEIEKKVGAIGGTVGAWIGGPLGAIVGFVVSWAIMKVIKWVIGRFEDDIFPPQLAAITLPTNTARFVNGSDTTQTSVFHWEEYNGIYRMGYDWKLTFDKPLPQIATE